MPAEMTKEQFEAMYKEFRKDIGKMSNIYTMVDRLNTIRENLPPNDSDIQTDYDFIFYSAITALFNRLSALRKMQMPSIVVTKTGGWYDYNGQFHSKDESLGKYSQVSDTDRRVIRL